MDPSAVSSSSDLFGGELFGDELMDMYSCVADVGGSEATDELDSISEIPSLLSAPDPSTTTAAAPSGAVAQEVAVKEEPTNHPGAHLGLSAATMAAIDDGLGAFRPSTSFNDLSVLDPSSGSGTPKSKSQSAATVVTTAELTAPVAATGTGAPAAPPPPTAPMTDEAKSKKRHRSGPPPAAPGAAPAPAPMYAPAPKKRAIVPPSVAAALGAPTVAVRHFVAAPPAAHATATNAGKAPVPLSLPKAAATVPMVKVNHPMPPTKAGAVPMKWMPKPPGPAKPNAVASSAAAVKNTPNPLTFPKKAPHAVMPPKGMPKVMTTTAPPLVLGQAAATAAAAAVVSPKAVLPPPPRGPVPATTVAPGPRAVQHATSAVITSRVPGAAPVPASVYSGYAPPKPQHASTMPLPPPAAGPRAGPGHPPRPAAVTAAAAAAAAAAFAAGAKVRPVGMPVPAPPRPPPRGEPTTEADFKSVAQQAVTNLILNASAAKQQPGGGLASSSAMPGKPCVASFTGKPDNTHKKPVDISSAHIAALTSSNWIAACSASVEGAPPGTQASAQAAALAAAAAANDPAMVKANRAKRANLTPDERARQNRDRNREHARNTRLRKKAYVEELKRTLTELVAQRDSTDVEKRHEAQRDLEVREVRFRVMEEFLKLRSQGGNATALLARWVAILEEGFTLTLPRTQYRATVRKDLKAARSLQRAVSVGDAAAVRAAKIQQTLTATEQVLRGAPQVMEDASYLAAFLNTLGGNGTSSVPVVGASTGTVGFAYHCDRKKFMMDGATAVLEWTASTSGAVGKGAAAELVMKGTIRATFSPASNKLVCAELLFDTSAVTAQMKSPVASPVLPPPTPVAYPPSCEAAATAAAAAQMTASEADALLDSIQMPQLAVDGVPPSAPLASQASAAAGAANAPPSSVSITSSDKGESSDESVEDSSSSGPVAAGGGVHQGLAPTALAGVGSV